MSKEYQQPEVRPYATHKGDEKSSIVTHPAYGLIAAQRVNGDATLYGSDFVHHHFIRVTINASESIRSLSRDWQHPREEYIEVIMSEAQWATFISTLNVGCGIPCTIQRAGGERIPQIPEPPKRKQQFNDELTGTFNVALKSIEELRKDLAGTKLSDKSKQEFNSKLNTIKMNINENLKFVSDQFGNHMESVTEHAKIEVEAYATGLIQRTGIEALGGGRTIIELPTNEEDV